MSEEPNQRRRRAIQTIGSVMVASLAGCSSSGTSNTPEQPADNQTANQTTNQTSTDTEGENATDEQTDADPNESAEFARNPEEVHPTLVEETPSTEDEVTIGFRLEDSSLPFTTEVYHAPDDAEYQATETYDTQDLAQVDLVPEPARALDTVDTDREDIHYGTTAVGEPLVVTLVARHDRETFDWSAWDRTGYPYDGHEQENPGLEVDCYCGGMIYTAPSGGTWARVIQVTPTERVDPGSTIVVNWTSSRA